MIDWLESLQGSGIRPGLGRMRALLRAIGNPQRDVRYAIVAGTNGKGSTSATLASILRESGYRTGFYSSPHLVDIRERWVVDGAMITAAELDRCIERLRVASDRASIVPTYFEALTLIAFIAFAEAGCEVGVLEVGMGGRLDATNVVRPVAALITPIGFDHMEYLGTTIRQIAREKAGVIHRGAIVVTSNEDPVVIEVLRRRAAAFDNRFETVTGDDVPPGAEVPLEGPYQRSNVALAAKGASLLRDRFPKITDESIRRGIEATRWRGRLERIEQQGRTFWIDGAHNAHAVEALVPFIESRLPRPRLLLFGVMSDKDVRAIARKLLPRFDRVIATEPYPPRSMRADEICAIARSLGVVCQPIPDPDDALAAALGSDEGTVLIAGSLYLAGAAVAFFDTLRARETTR